MAVVQISRIQLRRGRANETPIPQLASGELAWAIDTQELWIGNGAVGEGAPAVGNTKVLTEADATTLLDLMDYTYKQDAAPIQTGVDTNFPVVRSVQSRLDDLVFAANYGIVPSVSDQATLIQRAIDNLFLDNAVVGVKSRVTLEFTPGEYTFSSTIYLPSYVTIAGAGKQKTIFNYTGTGTAFEFVNDTSTTSVRSAINSTTYSNQPKFCTLTGFTLNAVESDAVGFKMNAVRDSLIADIEIVGGYATATDGIAISMYALSSVVTCQRNQFVNVTADGFTHDVYAEQDIFNNQFNACEFKNSQYGINFGNFVMEAVPEDRPVSFQYGPRKNTFENCYFDNIDREGIIVSNGTGNKSRGNTFVNVGNEGGGNTNNIYSQILFVNPGNSSSQDNFDRAIDLYYNESGAIVDRSLSYTNLIEFYLPEVSGKVHYTERETRTLSLVYTTSSYVDLFRIPFTASSGIEISYILESSANIQMRRGKITLSVDGNTGTVQLVDDYDYTGATGQELNIDFQATAYVGGGGILIRYKNDNNNDTALAPSTITYTYSIIS